MSTYSITYEFEDLPLLGTGAGYVSGKAFVGVDPISTDYHFEQVFLDEVQVPFDHALWDVVVTRLREMRDDDIRELAADIQIIEDRDVA